MLADFNRSTKDPYSEETNKGMFFKKKEPQESFESEIEDIRSNQSNELPKNEEQKEQDYWENLLGVNEETPNQKINKFFSKNKEPEEEPRDEKKQEWGEFQDTSTYQGEPNPTADEEWVDYIGRNLTTNLSRGFEIGLGKVGDTQQFIKDVATNFPQSTGLLGWALSEWTGPDAWRRMWQGKDVAGERFPTSSELQKLSETATGGYTKPKTPGEKKFQEFTKDFASMITPQLGPRSPYVRGGGMSAEIVRQGVITGAANLGKELVQDLGFKEDKANYAKYGIWGVLSLLDKVNAPAYASQMMNEGRIGYNLNQGIDVPRYLRRLDNVQYGPTMLPSDPRSALAIQQLNRLRENVANGQNSMQSAMTSYDGVNATKRSTGMFELGSADRNFARGQINRVLNAVREEIMDAGQVNPQALTRWQQGVNAWRVIHQSNGLSNWVSDLFRGPHKKLAYGIASTLFGGVSYLKDPLLAVTAAATGFALNKGYQVAYRVINDPVLARYYFDALTSATLHDLPAFIRNYEKLNEKLEKEESKDNRHSKNSKTKAIRKA